MTPEFAVGLVGHSAEPVGSGPGEAWPLMDWLDATFSGKPPAAPATLPAGLRALCEALDVASPSDLAVLAVAIAPDVAPEYGRTLAEVGGSVPDGRPSPRVFRTLLGVRAAEALERLGAAGLVHVRDGVEPDAHVVGLLFGTSAIHPRLRSFTRLVRRSDERHALPIDPLELQRAARDGPFRLWLGGTRREHAETLSAAIGRLLDADVVVVDLAGALATEPTLSTLAALVVREAWLHDGVLCFLEGDRLFDAAADTGTPARNLARALSVDGGVVVVQGEQCDPPGLLECPERPLGFVFLRQAGSSIDERADEWSAALERVGIELDVAARLRLAGRFRLDSDEIASAAQRAAARLALGLDSDPVRALTTASRESRGHRLASVAVRVDPRAHWDDLLLPAETRTQLRELVDLVTERDRVWDGGGFGASSSRGRGVSVLFAGASGTGKTTAAEVVANELGLDLYRIDLAGIVSKYVGETEKNLDRVFEAAEGSNAVLLFDEADAIFGKRSEVKDAHDRYANVEIAYLLQRIESYDGVAILTSNLRHHLDEAFLRRLTLAITFPLPDDRARQQLWASAWPSETRVEADVDRVGLAHRHRLTGGGVRNVALYAAHLAAASGKPVNAIHIQRALKREYAKLGVALDEVSA